VRAALVALALLIAAAPAAAAPAEHRFAIVIGNNRSTRADTAPLRYADDDAIAMHQLLLEAGVDSVLLARPDPGAPAVRPDGPPRWDEVRRALARHEAAIRAANAAGARTSLLVFYSGHGNVARGEGYVELEDARLTRGLLRRAILEPSAAGEIHVVVDACRSYFLAFEKGPGGRRRPSGASLASAGRGGIGWVLSTSSDRESHEWERFQGGIFSHEVRSALRGAADVDRDGRVSYAELGAFLAVANRAIENERFRPDYVVRPPGALGDDLLAWPAGGETLELDAPGHVLLEGPDGARIADANPAVGAPVALRLPPARPLFVRWSSPDVEATIAARTPTVRLRDLIAAAPRVASKGALHLAFARLFAEPFAAADVDAFAREAPALALESPPEGAAPSGGARRIAGTTAIVAGVVAVGLGGWAIERSVAAGSADQQARVRLNDRIANLRLGAAASAGVAVAAGGLWLWLRHRDAEAEDEAVIAPTLDEEGGVGAALVMPW
jgi:hypothetical protein